jgi:hypothetical protein
MTREPRTGLVSSPAVKIQNGSTRASQRSAHRSRLELSRISSARGGHIEMYKGSVLTNRRK